MGSLTEKHDSHSCGPSDVFSSWPRSEKEAHCCREKKTATCGWERAWKWQRGFFSMFEEQLLTFTAKSSNMLSVTSGLWAWRSPGSSVIMEIFVDVCPWSEPRGAFTSHYHRAVPSIKLPSLWPIPPNVAPPHKPSWVKVSPRGRFCFKRHFSIIQHHEQQEPVRTIILYTCY